METFTEIISAWESPQSFGEDVGTTANHGYMMCRRNSIPAKFWGRTVRQAKKRRYHGITLALMAELAEK